ncbi:thiamine pyrophosphate-dependent dehydrogenase E1 component subunit alpha [Desulfococcus multivorans]|jgi:pyruvate dehydrogenase E1 component alpha subunit|uniref:Dehydrogenase E1 component n=2 Tax=Desulfococcus TaxID=896 RepID=S7V3T5_DESML|nr:thiamine pyrophosphate-dependent dehydrogenase E1 component subunit alpha [Desulfococcus multivorans]AOY57489.1 AcoA: TPP-dependent acetoin dehydrogenase E1, subunit alpha [Desulfococcus multivorans]AQV02853.2 pyruvate dehydrogenase (acetyl-transferring) E1 component subunit alpha [Desulfococcus multivorans]EPR39333.1 dehydrogenase E1 component [Desulfococcus multivorans DSM 2059]MDX9818428.1 thiamine pyrophosphate-dependent dehydrogenase E1 component subunit alpha [Desulfococcus multivorans
MEIPKAKKMEMLRSLLLSRRFEETLTELCKIDGKIPGMMILCTGQEAVGAGVCAALQPEDAIITNHRSHSHLLAKGADPNSLMAEIYGKRTGCNKGKSGTLHLAVPEINAPCTTTVVGGGPPIAAGRAFAQQYRGEKSVTVCFIGDGAANEGSFHEALNLASVWHLPVIFVCENNLYAGAQRYEEHTRVEHIADRAAGYAVPGVVVDGNDALAVYASAVDARARAIAGKGPTLIEYKTYRWRGHGESDLQLYQPREEIAAWQAACPIPKLRGDMLAQGLISADELAAMERAVEAVVKAAVRFAEESPYPEPHEALEDVFA